jgi:peptide/nickel transport system substrate-binding protein
MVYDTLFAMDSELRPQPQMVGGWTASDDKLTYTFTLRNGLRFHDGQRVRAADVVASLNRWGHATTLTGSRCSPRRQRSSRSTTNNSASR